MIVSADEMREMRCEHHEKTFCREIEKLKSHGDPFYKILFSCGCVVKTHYPEKYLPKTEHNKTTDKDGVEIVVIRGLPGSGKSTLAAEQFPDHLHYEPDHLISDTRGRYRFDDQFFAEAQSFVQHLADFALARGESVVVSDVFPSLAELEPYQELAEAHGASMRVIDCTEQFGNCHRVPVLVMKRMRQQFEPWPGDQSLPEFLKRQAD